MRLDLGGGDGGWVDTICSRRRLGDFEEVG